MRRKKEHAKDEVQMMPLPLAFITRLIKRAASTATTTKELRSPNRSRRPFLRCCGSFAGRPDALVEEALLVVVELPDGIEVRLLKPNVSRKVVRMGGKRGQMSVQWKFGTRRNFGKAVGSFRMRLSICLREQTTTSVSTHPAMQQNPMPVTEQGYRVPPFLA